MKHDDIKWIPVPGNPDKWLGISYCYTSSRNITWLLMCRVVGDETHTFPIFSSESVAGVGAKLYEEIKQNKLEDEPRTRHRKIKAWYGHTGPGSC